MPFTPVSSTITALGGDNIVNDFEAGPGGFVISGTAVFSSSDPIINETIPVVLTFSGGITQSVTAIVTSFSSGGGSKTFNWTITDTNLSTTPPVQGVDAVSVKFPTAAASSAPFTFTFDTITPGAPSILSVIDNVVPGTGSLSAGASTNDTDLAVSVSVTGLGAVAGDTVQLYNGTGTGSPLGIHTITSQDLTNGAASIQTGTLSTTGTFDLTARLIDQAGNTSGASSPFTVVEDPSAVCFARGTRLLTSTGEVLVEALQPGVPMVANDGTVASVKWIGRRRIDLTAHPRPETVAPIRIRRDAFADNMPHTDLLVSPDHAIFVDGKLVCARQLINGTTIRQEKGWTSVEYFHVELDAHTILLAEGLPAESYLNTGNHGFFANSGEPLVLHPDLTDETDYPTREAASCAPFVSEEASVRPIWQRLAERAATLGQPAPELETTGDPELRIVAKGRTLQPLYGENGLYIFALPKGATEVRLVSRACSPTDVRPWLEDRRCLGVYVERIVLRGVSEVRAVPVDHPGLSRGWWAVEKSGIALRRWTNGDAVLPLPAFSGPAMLEVRLGGAMTYVVEVDTKAETAAERKVVA
jgi:hypothetical protein